MEPRRTAAANEAAPSPTKAPCWPDDPDWLDGTTEIFLPSDKYLKACWDADILDTDDKNIEDTIIESKEDFKVRFRVHSRAGCGSASPATGASMSASRPSGTDKTSTCPTSCPMT